jgi:hypothetical protein
MARANQIRYADLSQFLEGLGFVCRKLDESRVVWEHPQYGAPMIFPAYQPEQFIWTAEVGFTRATLDLHGLLDRDEFDRWRLNLHESQPPNGRRDRPGKKRKPADKSKPSL